MRAKRAIRSLEKVGRLRASPSGDYLHPFSRALGRVIREWRVGHGMTRYAVAERARLSRETLAGVERGAAWFSVNVAARICDAMGLDLQFAMLDALRRCRRLRR